MNPKRTIIAVFILFFSIYSYGQELVEVWRTGPNMKTPESVLYDHGLGVIFVANINENPAEKDGNGFISQLNSDGTVKNMEWVTGLSAPKGMAIYDGKLYVSDIDELVEIDIANAKISKRYPGPGAVFLNDVAASPSGMIFVSDSRGNKMYVLESGKFTVWKEGDDLKGINGLYTENDKLYIGSDKILEAGINSKSTKEIQSDCQGIDGLEKDNDGNFVFSNWAGRIFYLEEGKMTKMWDSTEKKINTADLYFAKELDLLLVPTFFDNQVVAYQIKR
jgi:outer membrane protein assembly factor BamB